MQSASTLVADGHAVAKSPDHREHTSDAFFAVYSGISMNPTLHEPEVLEVIPYGERPLRVGDVAFFRPPGSNRAIVHRIVRISPAGISTRGDNSNREDSILLNSHCIQGRVVAAWRGHRRRRRIAGGWRGRLICGWGRCRSVILRGLSPLSRLLYRQLSHWQWFAHALPAAWRPRVVAFGTGDNCHFQLLMGRRVIGQCDCEQRRWRIQPPFRLFVDVAALPVPPEQGDVATAQTAISALSCSPHSPWTPRIGYDLALADGSHWRIVAENLEASAIVAKLGGVMKMTRASGGAEPPPGRRWQLAVKVVSPVSVADCYVPTAEHENGLFSSVLCPCSHWGGPYVNLVRLSLIIAEKAQAAGGILIHGALAERSGVGVILAAPGGTGKTTASNRLPKPWRSWCDDATLVVRDDRGRYLAHPWPTWSRFINHGSGGAWDIQRAVPLRGIFFLAQSPTDRVERIGSGQAAGMLVEAVKQTSMFMSRCFPAEEIRTVHLQRFHNICDLSGMVPAHILHLGLTGPFWTEIEKALKIGRFEETPGNGNASRINKDRT